MATFCKAKPADRARCSDTPIVRVRAVHGRAVEIRGRGVRAIGWLVLGGLLLGVTACGEPESPAARYAQDPEALKRGKSLFVGTCGAYCHGMQPGHRDAPYLFDCEWKHGGRDEEIFRTIRAGVPNTRMQAFADRMPEGDDDLWKIVAFIRSRSDCS